MRSIIPRAKGFSEAEMHQPKNRMATLYSWLRTGSLASQPFEPRDVLLFVEDIDRRLRKVEQRR